jgi:hypothetical protein
MGVHLLLYSARVPARLETKMTNGQHDCDKKEKGTTPNGCIALD